MPLLVQSIVIGVIATITIDIWALLLKTIGLPKTDWAMVGRWLGHLPSGKFTHNPISSSGKIENELVLGWLFHYLIGFIYAVIYLFGTVYLLGIQPTLISALAFGVVTVTAPWFILQPGLGLGICASKAPKPALTRTLNLLTHSIFGVALYAGWTIVAALN